MVALFLLVNTSEQLVVQGLLLFLRDGLEEAIPDRVFLHILGLHFLCSGKQTAKLSLDGHHFLELVLLLPRFGSSAGEARPLVEHLLCDSSLRLLQVFLFKVEELELRAHFLFSLHAVEIRSLADGLHHAGQDGLLLIFPLGLLTLAAVSVSVPWTTRALAAPVRRHLAVVGVDSKAHEAPVAHSDRRGRVEGPLDAAADIRSIQVAV